MAGYTTPAWDNLNPPALNATNLTALGHSAELGEHPYGVCSTAAATAAKTVTIDYSGTLTLYEGLQIRVKFANGNTAQTITLNVNGTGNIPVIIRGVESTWSKQIDQYTIVTFVYGGENWVAMSFLKMPAFVNPNLLKNWYFAGGGTGHGVFPVNQRAQSTYSSGWVFDRWSMNYSTSQGTLSLGESGITLSHSGTGYAQISQNFENYSHLAGRTATVSAIVDNVLRSVSITIGSQSSSKTLVGNLQVFSISGQHLILRVNTTGSYVIKAVKCELGDTQTLAHQENGAWVLNEIPDYGEELARCMSSSADSTDTYANFIPADRGVLLWTNGSPQANFAAQTISLPTNKLFSAFLIAYAKEKTNSAVATAIIPRILNQGFVVENVLRPAGGTVAPVLRTYTPASAGMQVAVGRRYGSITAVTYTEDNSVVVPRFIYGLF